MSDFQERLMAADPVAGLTYAHRDAETMISRIVSQHPIQRSSILRDFKLKMAGAVTMATLVTVGGIAALDGAIPGLPVLALASAHKSLGASGTAPGAMMMRIFEEFNFTAGSGLSNSPANVSSFQLKTATSGSGEASRIASVFSVNGTPVDTNADGTYWTVTDSAGPSVTYDNYGGVPQWNYSDNASNTVAVPPPSAADSSSPPLQGAPTVAISQSTMTALEARATGILAKLGYDYQVSDPQFTSSSMSDGTTVTNQEDLSYNVVVGGMTTDQSVQFTFDANNQLADASGPAFSVASSANYPLQSEVAGVAVLNAQQQSYFANGTGSTPTPGGPVTPMDSSSTPTTVASGSSSGTPDPAVTTTTDSSAPATPPIVDVTLDSAIVTLQSYNLTDGSLWLLPIYSYSGNVVSSDGTSSPGTWTTMAIDPSYVQVSVKTGPILY